MVNIDNINVQYGEFDDFGAGIEVFKDGMFHHSTLSDRINFEILI